MKTAGRENPIHGVRVPRNRAHGAVGQNRSRSIKWAAKQEKSQPENMCFFLTSPFIELIRWDEKAGLGGMRYAPNNRRARSTRERRPAVKKISTVAKRGNDIFKQSKLTIGLDLGDRTSHYCILDGAGNVILEHSLPTTPNGIQQVFRRIPRSRIALETGTHSPWVSRQLTQMGHEVIVAHARNVRLIGESSRKDDQLDARTLARLARIDPSLVGPVQHRSAKAQIHLTVIRARAGLVGARTALVNAARGLTKSYGERLRKCGTQQMNGEMAKGLSQELRDALEPLLREVESLNERIREYDRRIEQLAKEVYPEVSLLEKRKSGGTLIALTYVLS